MYYVGEDTYGSMPGGQRSWYAPLYDENGRLVGKLDSETQIMWLRKDHDHSRVERELEEQGIDISKWGVSEY